MPIVSTTKDPDALSFTIVTDLAAPPTRVWQIWSDPRQLERWWGPPTWPATVEQHDFVVGGRATYYMTGPDGEKSRGWWRFLALDAPRSLEFEDGFADESGEPSDAMPVIRGLVELEATTSGTRMTITTSFASVADMEQIMGMGVVEGMTGAMGQIDNIVAEG